MNFATYADTMARNYPERLAMSDRTREVTFAELSGEVDAVANALEDLGVDAGTASRCTCQTASRS